VDGVVDACGSQSWRVRCDLVTHERPERILWTGDSGVQAACSRKPGLQHRGLRRRILSSISAWPRFGSLGGGRARHTRICRPCWAAPRRLAYWSGRCPTAPAGTSMSSATCSLTAFSCPLRSWGAQGRHRRCLLPSRACAPAREGRGVQGCRRHFAFCREGGGASRPQGVFSLCLVGWARRRYRR
jgi:hypothetical protein